MSEITIPQQEFGGTPEDISAFNEAMGAISEHNDQFSMGKMMARTLLSIVEKRGRVQDLVDEGATQEEAEETVAFVSDDSLPLSEEEQMARSIVGIINAPVLESTGLVLSPLRKTATMYGHGIEQSVGEVRLQITDGSRFSGFLQTVNQDSVDDRFKNNISEVVSSLINEAQLAISQDVDEATALETLAYGQGIVAGLERIGLADDSVTNNLRLMHKHAQRGDVKEYVLADMKQLLVDPADQRFGPANWQRDATPDSLDNRWNEVLEVLKLAKDNPKATELFDQMVGTVRISLDFASKEWATLKENGYAKGDYGNGFEKIFEATKLELDLLASPDETEL